MLTVTLNNGRTAIAKMYQGQPMAKTFANRTQAEKCAKECGPGWAVYHGGRPFFVCRVWLFQVWDTTFNDERFCFHATSEVNARHLLSKWCSYHGFDTDTRQTFDLRNVDAPKYADNIHNEWV